MRVRFSGSFVLWSLLAGACFVSRLGAQDSLNQKLIVDAGDGNLTAVKQDLANGADVNARENENGNTALISAAGGHSCFNQINPGDYSGVVAALLDRHADVNARNNRGDTALHESMDGCADVSVVKLLLARGANVNARDNDGKTALIASVYGPRVRSARALLQSGADVDAEDNNGNTALMLAVDEAIGHSYFDWSDMISLFLEHGANANATNHYGARALDFAESCIPQMRREDQNAAFPHENVDDKTSYFLAEEKALVKATDLDATLKWNVNYLNRLDPKKDNGCVRPWIIKLSTLFKSPPAIPEDARAYMITGLTLMHGARSSQDFNQAIGEFMGAVSAAPWWGDAYRNLGVAEEAAGRYRDAIIALEFYLDTNPPAPDTRMAHDEISKIEGKLKLAGKD